MKRFVIFVLAAALVAPACADEDPVGVGGELLPGGVIRTFEVVLGADAFLVGDTALSGFERPSTAAFGLVARDFADTLDAHALVRFGRPALVFRDAGGTSQIDSLPVLVSGTVLARIDTAAGVPDAPIELNLFTIEDAWDAGSATWRLRIDTAGVSVPWDVPGAEGGRLLGSATVPPGADTAVFTLDSAALAHFADTTAAGRGVMVASATAGVRLQLASLLLRVEGRPRERQDTLVSATVAAEASTFIFDPRLDPTDGLRVGGIPAWRSFLMFRQALGDIVLECATQGGAIQRCAAREDTASLTGPTVRLRLGDAHVAHAALLLEPLAVRDGFQPLDTLRFQVREVLPSPFSPLARAPVGALATPRAQPLVAAAPSLFDSPSAAGPVEVPITDFVTALLRGPETDEAPDPASVLALIALPERTRFGLAAFGAEGSAAPRLRLILTVAGGEAFR